MSACGTEPTRTPSSRGAAARAGSSAVLPPHQARAVTKETIGQIRPVKQEFIRRAEERQSSLTKPPGSLGDLEHIANRLAAIQETVRPRLASGTVVIMAGDHGITAHKVSPYPSEVTRQMIANFRNGGAAINAIAAVSGLRIRVVDIGVAGPILGVPQAGRQQSPDKPVTFEVHRVRNGTSNTLLKPAMELEEAYQAIAVGIHIARDEAERRTSVIALGEMGIGNTTATSAITAKLTGRSVREVTGPGTGLSEEQVQHKIRTIEQVLAVHPTDADDPVGILAAVGGLEIAGLVGVVLGAALHRIPVLLDGFITTAAALVAARLAKQSRDYLFASHCSPEPGHSILLDALGLEPMLKLGMRLGEGTGAALVFPLLRSAAAVLSEMATFEEAGISNR